MSSRKNFDLAAQLFSLGKRQDDTMAGHDKKPISTFEMRTRISFFQSHAENRVKTILARMFENTIFEILFSESIPGLRFARLFLLLWTRILYFKKNEISKKKSKFDFPIGTDKKCQD